MRVLVTGCAGYIGSVLTRQLLDKGHHVRGVDALFFGGDPLLDIVTHPRFEFVRADVRDSKTLAVTLDGIETVAHLAAIVGDPACAQQPDLARAINLEASTTLLRLCNESPSVQRFAFASTCSNYGKMQGDGYVDETSPLRPVSLYAELKVGFEKHLLQASLRPNLIPTALRFATVYGVSPRMRFDLTVNEFVRDLALGRTLRVFGQQFWRPYCHVEDLARSVVLVLECPAEKVRQDVFNVGDTRENYTKEMIVNEIFKCLHDVPRSLVTYVQKTEDPRDYRVDFSKIHSTLGFEITKRVPDGIRELSVLLRQGLISDPDAAKFKNV
ncbi:MAG: NAD-dependent epimerase/dehydratase family protein [Verrucomicrobiia bacterium]